MNSKENKNSISEGKIREVANRIFVGDITWEQAAKTLKMAEKTLRKQVSERVTCFAENIIRTGGRVGWGFMFNVQVAIK